MQVRYVFVVLKRYDHDLDFMEVYETEADAKAFIDEQPKNKRGLSRFYIRKQKVFDKVRPDPFFRIKIPS